MRAFVTYVRLLLEYASCVSSPYTIGQVTKIEAVQRFLCCCGLQYSEELTKLKMGSLELLRRLHLCVQDTVWYNLDRCIRPIYSK